MKLRLYSYFRSSASWRVRIGLALKGLDYEYVPVHLLKERGAQLQPPYRERNPLDTVPLLDVLDDRGALRVRIGESLAILGYLDEVHPAVPLLPGTPELRARARWMAEIVNSDIHPLQNLSTLQTIEKEFGAGLDARKAWATRWIRRGFAALEPLVAEGQGPYCAGKDLTLADVCLVPQVFNARRFGMTLEGFPALARVVDRLEREPAFITTDPFHQPDTPPEERKP